ncbi:MAG TPA: tripartite tricarboxylate transporter substrate binding protein [Burkholderiales bacterium]|nr:tripartite tricarboxylate transporter substrate binding protein [Burkholderiales bacterium]
MISPRIALLPVLCLLAVGAASASDASGYPARPVRFIVPFGTGGSADLTARLFAQKLTESLGQSFVIDNRTGAGGIVGAEIGARSTPDGYTVVLGSFGTHTANPILHPKLSYDPIRDFAPVSLMAIVPTILVVHPTVPAKTVADLIALAKAKPGALNYASSGTGTGTHLAGELFKNLAAVDMVHVPYKSAGTAITDLVAGQVQLMYSTLPSVLPLVKSGKLRALGITTAKRSDALPDVPAIGESLKTYDVATWFGALAPAGTPRPIVDTLAGEIRKAAAMPDVRARLVTLGAEPVGNTPKEFAHYIRAEIAKWTRVIRAANIKAD